MRFEQQQQALRGIGKLRLIGTYFGLISLIGFFLVLLVLLIVLALSVLLVLLV
jgi:hypothetical protein